MIFTKYDGTKYEVMPISGYKLIHLREIDENGEFVFDFYPVIAAVNQVSYYKKLRCTNGFYEHSPLSYLAVGCDKPYDGPVLTPDGQVIDSHQSGVVFDEVYENLDEYASRLRNRFNYTLPTVPFEEGDINYFSCAEKPYDLIGLENFKVQTK